MGLIVCPSRELARQTQEVITGYLEALRAEGAPELRSLLVMGGIDMRQQVVHLLLSDLEGPQLVHAAPLLWQ